MVGLRVRILIDGAENLAVMDQLPNVGGIVTGDELDLLAAVPDGEVNGRARLPVPA